MQCIYVNILAFSAADIAIYLTVYHGSEKSVLPYGRTDFLYNENPQFYWGFKKLSAMDKKDLQW